MGRPLNKRYFGDAIGKVKVTHYRRATGAEQTGEQDTHIVSQRSTNKFLVADTSGGWSEVLTLVDKDPGSLANGEFRIQAIDEDGQPGNVVRFYNRTLRISGPRKVFWDPDLTPAGTTFPVLGVTLTGNDPVVITTSSTAEFTTGDTISIQGVSGTTELNGNTYIVTVVDGTTISLDGTDSADFSAYSGPPGGITGVGGRTTVDTQSS